MKRSHSTKYRTTVAMLAVAALVHSQASAGDEPFYAQGVGVIAEEHDNRLTFVASGEAIHLEEWDLVLRIRIHGESSRSRGTFVAADGDELDVVIDSVTDYDLPGQVGTFQIRGGTGRFRRASGGGQFQATVLSFEPEILEVIFDGTIHLVRNERELDDDERDD